MTSIEALERFCRNIDRDVCEMTIRARCSDCDLWPEAMVAAVSLAGCLDDARTDDDLVAGVQHFVALYDADIFTDDQWIKETDAVIAAVAAVAVPLEHSNQSDPPPA